MTLKEAIRIVKRQSDERSTCDVYIPGQEEERKEAMRVLLETVEALDWCEDQLAVVEFDAMTDGSKRVHVAPFDQGGEHDNFIAPTFIEAVLKAKRRGMSDRERSNLFYLLDGLYGSPAKSERLFEMAEKVSRSDEFRAVIMRLRRAAEEGLLRETVSVVRRELF